MREVYGIAVLGSNGIAELKRKALMFDRFIVVSPLGGLFHYHDSLSRPELELMPECLQADFEYLESRGLLLKIERSGSAAGELFLKGTRLMSPWRDDTAMAAPEVQAEIRAKCTNAMTGVVDLDSDAYRAYADLHIRAVSTLIYGPVQFDVVPIYCTGFPDTSERKLTKSSSLLNIGLKALPAPSEDCSWEAILEFRQELAEKRWGFRRWLQSLAQKDRSEAEIRDDIEWTVSEYRKAMAIHKIKASQSFVDVFVICPLEIIENLVKFNWSKIAKGALSVQKRKVELMEAEMKAPGRECAYVFDARTRFSR
jgi:hypothetical protein